MQAKQKIFLILSTLGLLLLLLLSSFLHPKTIEISEISEKNLNQEISITAKISHIKSYNNNTFYVLNLSDKNSSTTGILNNKEYNNLKEKINLSLYYIITGKINEYNNTLQISINKIIKK